MSGQNGNESGHHKTVRKRLQRQLEFYLSASNLRQDKFLQENMDEEGYIAINLFLAFNKVKNMRATEKMLLEAAEKSSLLVVDKVGSRIAPKESPFDQEDDSIERTLYLENYNRSHDHDSLRKELSKYGKIQLVSMPRFKQSKKFKGFAFIEFGTKEAASNAMKEIQMQSQVADGMKVMTKKRWVEIKEALKKELYDDSIVSKNHDEKGNKKKRKRSDIDVFSSSAAHIHFATSSEEEDSTK